MEQETKHIRIHGYVQGVGYRAWASKLAMRLALKGWVRNVAHDASVEAVVTGYAEDIQKFVSQCYDGPQAAKVDIVHVTEGINKDFKEFEIRETA